MDGLRMSREEETNSNKETRVLHYKKRLRYIKKEIVVGREAKHKVFEKRDPNVVLHITPYRERKEKEKDP
jgi:hypothetical protein